MNDKQEIKSKSTDKSTTWHGLEASRRLGLEMANVTPCNDRRKPEPTAARKSRFDERDLTWQLG